MIILINILVFIITVYIQSAVFGRFDLFGFVPNMVLILIVIFSLYRKIYEAYVFAFVTGFVLDILSAGPFGIYTTIFMAVVFVSGLIVDEDHSKISTTLASTFLAISALVFYITFWVVVSYQSKNFTLSGFIFSIGQTAITLGVFLLVFPYLKKVFLWEEKTGDVRIG